MLPISGNPAPKSALFSAAEIYLLLNWSVIPIRGDGHPDQPKAAAVEWKTYQRRRPDLAEVGRWFDGTPEGSGIAIITGAVSQLLILDFDAGERFAAFQHQCPNLTDTRTVRTRRGHHLYFHIPPGLSVASRHVPGLDILFNGRYAIAPPSSIAGHVYQVLRGGAPKTLSQRDLEAIERFAGAGDFSPPETPRHQPTMRVSAKLQKSAPAVRLTESGLRDHYRYQAVPGNRNNALFQSALMARDFGWSAAATTQVLGDAHLHTRRGESAPGRYREAVATIQSAFSRPPRPRSDRPLGQLPNGIREALLQQRQTHTVRVIEGLRLRGLAPGQGFTESQACELLQNLVGHYSIRQALTATTSGGKAVFRREKAVQPPSGHPQTPNGVATKNTRDTISKCLEISSSKPKLNCRGRRKLVYTMPSNAELAAHLGIQTVTPSDPLDEADLRSARTTRQALHRTLIKRRPGQYTCYFLANRLGISCLTLQRYNASDPLIHVVPMYSAIAIHWHNLKAIPVDFVGQGGLFLEDGTGKRYPPEIRIARWLLATKKRVILKRREPNFYWYGETPPAAWLALGIQPQRPDPQKVEPWRQNLPAEMARTPTPLPERAKTAFSGDFVVAGSHYEHRAIKALKTPGEASKAGDRSTVCQRTVRRRSYRRPLKDAREEGLAQRVYTAINLLKVQEARHMSQATARRLIDRYGVALVEEAVAVVQQRKNIRNPAGFLETYLRSASRMRARRS